MTAAREVRFVNPDTGSGGFGNGLVSGSNCFNLDVQQYPQCCSIDFDTVQGGNVTHRKVYVPWIYIRYVREK